MDLTDEQWAILGPLMGEMPRRVDGRGRGARRSGRSASATPHESRLVAPTPPTLDSRLVAESPQRLIGDRAYHAYHAYHAYPLDAELAMLGVEMIAPHRRNRTTPKAHDGRPLRRSKRRWKIERLFAWLGSLGKFRRLAVRYERHARNDLGFVQLGCILIMLRQGQW
jgi:transposase